MGDLRTALTGRFIVFDGPDGGGKSTQLALLRARLEAEGLPVTATRDPGGTPIGDRLREVLLDPAHTEMTTGCEMLLYMASRAQLYGEVIAPALAERRCVLCDRWVSSTLAYQVAEGKASAAQVRQAYAAGLGEVRPDLTLILDVPAEAGLGRLRGPRDRVESKSAAFHRRVRELFLEQADEAPQRFAVIDATGAIEQVAARIRTAVESRAARRA